MPDRCQQRLLKYSYIKRWSFTSCIRITPVRKRKNRLCGFNYDEWLYIFIPHLWQRVFCACVPENDLSRFSVKKKLLTGQ